MEADSRARVVVHGRVQGVFFRAETRQMARELALSGWVMNRPDGAVEALFEGDMSSVEKAVEWCRHGPPSASVSSVEVTWGEPAGAAGFKIRHSG
jgi:acylphosphatase